MAVVFLASIWRSSELPLGSSEQDRGDGLSLGGLRTRLFFYAALAWPSVFVNSAHVTLMDVVPYVGLFRPAQAAQPASVWWRERTKLIMGAVAADLCVKVMPGTSKVMWHVSSSPQKATRGARVAGGWVQP
jgi:hypothetical protein